ncbi:MAG: hypothetical protein K0R15_655 [Clostridiales bacterium]|jgi:hypothetical protein|nr:hypothetical protein [Clostridiales bacterium]
MLKLTCGDKNMKNEKNTLLFYMGLAIILLFGLIAPLIQNHYRKEFLSKIKNEQIKTDDEKYDNIQNSLNDTIYISGGFIYDVFTGEVISIIETCVTLGGAAGALFCLNKIMEESKLKSILFILIIVFVALTTFFTMKMYLDYSNNIKRNLFDVMKSMLDYIE